MRVIHVRGDHLAEIDRLPASLPADGYVWISCDRATLKERLAEVQSALQRWIGATLFDLHVADLLNAQLPSNFDYTSAYDLLIFRRLAPGSGTGHAIAEKTGAAGAEPMESAGLDTSPVGFALFDRVLLSVHPADCSVRDFFVKRLQQQAETSDLRGGARLPLQPAELMLRMVNHIVDSYLELRRLLTHQSTHLQEELLQPGSPFTDWQALLDSRNSLSLLEDTCEDQRSAIVEWIDALDEWPEAGDPTARRERELLRVRSRDVLEHIDRVLSHVRRLESSAETAVQMHFSAQSHRANNIMRTLTVLTAIFLPLNLVTGFFGMNFERLPLIHSSTGFWIIFALMLAVGVGLSVFFWRKRYLRGSH